MTARSFSTMQVARLCGVTYRRLDYWCRSGLLTPSIASARGNGTARRYSEDDVRIAIRISRCLETISSFDTVRDVMGFIRDPEGCRWLVIGKNGAAVSDGSTVPELLVELRGGLVVDLEVGAIDAPSESMRASWGREAG